MGARIRKRPLTRRLFGSPVFGAAALATVVAVPFSVLSVFGVGLGFVLAGRRSLTKRSRRQRAW
jgi:hypothetical protein